MRRSLESRFSVSLENTASPDCKAPAYIEGSFLAAIIRIRRALAQLGSDIFRKNETTISF